MRFSSGLATAPRSRASIASNARLNAGAIRSKKPSSNRIRLTSSDSPSAGMPHGYCWKRFQRLGVLIATPAGPCCPIVLPDVPSCPTPALLDHVEILLVPDQDHVRHAEEQPGADDAGNLPDVPFQPAGVRNRFDPAIEN